MIVKLNSGSHQTLNHVNLSGCLKVKFVIEGWFFLSFKRKSQIHGLSIYPTTNSLA